jgi:Tol biopolymer transport system component
MTKDKKKQFSTRGHFPLRGSCVRKRLFFILQGARAGSLAACLAGLAALLPAELAAFGQNKVILQERDWKIIKTSHFDIHFPRGYEHVASRAAIYSEEANVLLSEKLNHTLSSVVPIFIYPSHHEFATTNIIPVHLGEGTGGFTEPIKRRVVLPFNGSYDRFRHVLTHELVHAFQFDILLGNDLGSVVTARFASAPDLWVMEGMAEYMSIGWDETGDMTVRDAIIHGRLPTIQQMSRMQVPSVYIIYKAGQSVMHYIATVHGEHRIPEILRDLRDLRDLELTIKNNLDMDLRTLNNKWRRWLKKRYFPILKDKGYADEKAEQLTGLTKDDNAFFNFKPSLSPDGKSFVYLSSREMFPSLYIRKIEEDIDPEDVETRLLVQGYRSSDFEQLNILSNSLTWSADGKSIAFAAKSNGRPTLYLVTTEGKVTERHQPPVDIIERPSLSPDGKFLLFAGTVRGQTDIYSLARKDGRLRRLTADPYYESYPSMSADGKRVYYTSNRGPDKNIESRNWHLYEMTLADGSKRRITDLKGKSISPAPAADNNRVVFSNNATGVYNLYMYYREDKRVVKVTNVAGGLFEPQFSRDNKKIIFTSYENMGYNIMLADAPAPDFQDQDSVPVSTYTPLWYPAAPLRELPDSFQNYSPRFSPDGILFGFTLAAGPDREVGYGGFLQFAVSDYMGDHRIWSFMDYTNATGEPNFSVNYYYLKHRIKYYGGVFRNSNVSAFSLQNIFQSNWNFLFHNPYRFHTSLTRYGVEGGAAYPFTRFLRAEVGAEISRDEETFLPGTRRLDIFRNIQAGNLGLVYDNVVYSYVGPLDGFRGQVRLEQGAGLTGWDMIFTRSWVDLRYYLLFFKRHILAARGFAGIVEGRDSQLIPYQIGGFNTIRGYDFFSMRGRQAFFFNLEYRFPIIDAIIFGWPVQWGIGGFHWVFFLDGGSAFDSFDSYRLWDPDQDRLDDLKLSFGMGVRLVLFPGLILRIDWATPWDLRDALPIDRWSGEFSLGFGF